MIMIGVGVSKKRRGAGGELYDWLGSSGIAIWGYMSFFAAFETFNVFLVFFGSILIFFL